MLFDSPLDHGGGGEVLPLYRFIEGAYRPVYAPMYRLNTQAIDPEEIYSPALLHGPSLFFTNHEGRTIMLAYVSQYSGLQRGVMPYGYFYLSFDEDKLVLESIHTHGFYSNVDSTTGRISTNFYQICVTTGHRTPADQEAWWDEWVAHHYNQWGKADFLANPTIIGMPHEQLNQITPLAELEDYIIAAMRAWLGL